MPMDHHSAMRVVREHVHHNSRLVTDAASWYRHPPLATHESVDHSKFEWVRGDVRTNTLEGFFSMFKLRLIDVY
jgi:ISXO2-like transposase domain